MDSKVIRAKSVQNEQFLYKCSTETLIKMLLRVLEFNDNSGNDYDDSFYLKDLLCCLGRLDNI